MVETAFNLFDLIVLITIVLSSLLSFLRGFVREVLSLGAWVGASMITLYTFPDVAEYLKPYVGGSKEIASGVGAMGIFFISLITISIFNNVLMRLFKKGKDVGLLDNGLGLAFGVLRAGLLLSLGYYIMSIVMTEDNYPEWIAEASTRPYVEKGAAILDKIAPEYLDAVSPIGDDGMLSLDGVDTDSLDSESMQNILDHVKSAPQAEGYEWMNVEDLERMIDHAQEQQPQQ